MISPFRWITLFSLSLFTIRHLYSEEPELVLRLGWERVNPEASSRWLSPTGESELTAPLRCRDCRVVSPGGEKGGELRGKRYAFLSASISGCIVPLSK